MYRPTSYIVDVSGIARGNPGLAGVGGVIRDSDGRIIDRVGRYLGLATPIQADYHAVIAGLEAVLTRGPREVCLRISNETVSRQLLGRSPVRTPDIIELYIRAEELVRQVPSIEIRHVSPETIELAEQIADVALTSRGRRTAVD